MKKMIVVLLGVLCLLGCSQFESNGEKLYLRSKNGPNIVEPPPLTDSNISHFYDLPPQPKKGFHVGVEPPNVEPNES